MLLEIDKLNVSFTLDTGQQQPEVNQVLHDVSLSVDQGATVALVGESGSGKSVTALSILRLLEEGSQVHSSGRINFEGKNILTLTDSQLRAIRGNRIAMIFQEPMTSLNPVYTIGNQLIEPLLLHRSLTKNEAEKEAVRLLDRTGIDTPAARLHTYPHQLSGGQRQRVMIAMALACRPSLLIADEPTTALDVTIQAQILDLIRDLQDEFKMAVLLITHDLAMVRQIAGSVHIMQDGRIVEHGPTKGLLDKPQHPYTIHLLQSIPQGSPEEKHGQPPLLSLKGLDCHFHLKDGWSSFLKRKIKTIKAVDDVSLTLNQGTTCGVVGESGSGKTTLGMAILKLTKSHGTINFDGRDLQQLTNRQMRPLRRELQVVFQDPFSSLSPRMTVEQIVEEGMRVHNMGGPAQQRHEIVAETLAEVGLSPEMAYRYPHEFSGGQRQRIAIARAIVLKPRLLILDEPTSALDMTIQKQIIDLLLDLQKRYGMTYLFISHDLRVIRAMADQVAVMQHGRIVEAGPARKLFAAPTHAYTQRLFAAALH
ncbi:MAG: ABC transporter ATP-binding protein [Proteobacteria bacterium]|nr:ABC transporter ATP-binding protein [Pseudomonadota bacterium]MBU1649511.1 ABC transporter ATP-binding protein [Pseudomonadota bacterium]MBU1986854.1 ABC transporter ATP-binding protein [Pseudomonadota bacterium]